MSKKIHQTHFTVPELPRKKNDGVIVKGETMIEDEKYPEGVTGFSVSASGDHDYKFCVCPVGPGGVDYPPIALFSTHEDALLFYRLKEDSFEKGVAELKNKILAKLRSTGCIKELEQR